MASTSVCVCVLECVCESNRLELLAQLLVEVGGLLQSSLQGGDLLLLDLQRGLKSGLKPGLQQLKPGHTDRLQYISILKGK